MPDAALLVASFHCREGVTCGKYLHTKQCLLQLVVGRVCLVINDAVLD